MNKQTNQTQYSSSLIRMAGKSKSKSSSKSGASSGSNLKTAMSAHNNPAARIKIPQTIGLPGQVANNAGGYSFALALAGHSD